MNTIFGKGGHSVKKQKQVTAKVCMPIYKLEETQTAGDFPDSHKQR